MPNGEEETTQTGSEESTEESSAQPVAEVVEDVFDKDRALNTIKNLRESERTLKKKTTDQDRRLKELEDAQKTESEKIQEELAELRQIKDKYQREARERVARDAFVTEAQKQGALRPDALFRLADGLEFDDDGKPTNTSSVIKDMKGAYPELFGQNGSADGRAGRASASEPRSMSDLIRDSRRK